MTDEILNPNAAGTQEAAPPPADDTTELVDTPQASASGENGAGAGVQDDPIGDVVGTTPATPEAEPGEPAEPVTEARPSAQAEPEAVHEEARAAPEESHAPAEEPEAAQEPAPVVAAPVTTPEPVAAPTRAAVAAPAQMEEHTDDYSGTFTALHEGAVVQGVVVHIDREGVLVDVGTKSEGIIRRHELSRDPTIAAEDIVKVGDTISVYVMETENQEGNLILSKKRADFEKAWERVQEAKEANETLHAMVTDRVKGGLVVDLGIRGFVPASHVGNGSMKNNLERYVGQSIALKVIEVDKERRKVVLSNKLAADEDRASRKAETVSSLVPGQVRRGIVRRLTNYGAFVDLGGIDGLLHISEMSWTRINHPQEVLKEGQEIDVVILKMDLDAGRVSLGMRQILPDPWTEIAGHYTAGDIITGSVTRVVPFGVFVQVDGGVEGIIPNAELGSRKGGKTGAPLEQGNTVEVKVLDVRPEERKMTLSLRQLNEEKEQKRERHEVDEYQSSRGGAQEEPRFTIGDALRAKEEAEGE